MKSIKVDFLIVYEVKNRELENVCLLKCELERRGYTVSLYNTWNRDKEDIQYFDAKVVIGPWLYDDSRVYYLLTLAPKATKIVNLQWEQVFTNSDETNTNNLFTIKGAAREAVHISWGEKNRQRLVEVCGISKKKVKLVGNITLDFLRKEFRSYYLTRDELFRKFDIPIDKKVILFISSFSYVNISKDVLNNTAKETDTDLEQFACFSTESQSEIIKWFRKIMFENDNYVFVYRPHPAEADNIDILTLEKEFNNFYVIGDYSVKQWILTCDGIYTWYSTSLAEIYAAGKSCFILRPIEILHDFELPICKDAKFITNFDQFNESLINESYFFPLNEEYLSKYYEIDKKTPAYKKLCDLLEEIYNSDEYSFKSQKAIDKLSWKYTMKLIMRTTFIYSLYVFIKKIKKDFCNIKIKSDDYIMQMKNKNHSNNSEIEQILLKLKKLL